LKLKYFFGFCGAVGKTRVRIHHPEPGQAGNAGNMAAWGHQNWQGEEYGLCWTIGVYLGSLPLFNIIYIMRTNAYN
jgi:hypothetical protein